ncbi:DUF2256 domain-containing protein [Alcanivorax profundi]|uniref:DUF2256 domain-containing protein n=1 Tax=Alcanivorax profundi TaxID=2338368 RepID=UPI0032B17E55
MTARTASAKWKGNKAALPSKICPVCHRPFQWRKKWEKHWHEVVYCSQRCRRGRGARVHRQIETP